MPRIRKFNPKQRRGSMKKRELLKKNNISPDVSTNIPSASKRKISFDAEYKYNNNEEPHVSVVIQIEMLSALISRFVMCRYCKNVDCMILTEDVNNRRGFACKLVLMCLLCQEQDSCMSSSITNKLYDVNIRLVYAMRCIGKGQKAAKTFSAIMNLPSPPARFDRYNSLLLDALKNVSEKSMINAVKEVLEIENSRDIVVALDGSWQKRGHTSLNGVVTATSFDTGKVIDVEIFSKFCHGCSRNQTEHSCTRNYEGASGGMEVQGVLNIFMRSEATRGLRYTKYLGDGDTKAFKQVQEAQPYGQNVTIEKLECVGHVQKRLGTRLRKLRQSLSGKKLPDGKGIKGRGRLTDVEIENLQRYYGLAIRRNVGDLKGMKQAVWATFFHKMSTNENPIHNLCPKGPESWCGYQRHLINGSEYHHKHSLPVAVMNAIKPIYRDLADERILSKCLHGSTQNPNECFNMCIWERLPKTVFVGRITLCLGVYDAIICFNDGAQGRADVFKELKITQGLNSFHGLRAIDRERVLNAEKALNPLKNSERIIHRRENKRKNDEEIEENGSYGAGEF